MRLRLLTQFSASPLLALVPGLMMLAALSGGGFTLKELLVIAAVLVAGATWAGFRASRQLIEPPEATLDLLLASAVLDALPDPVILLDARRRVLASNQAAAEVLNVDLIDRDICLVLRQPGSQQAIKSVVDREVGRAEADIVIESPVRRHFQLQAIAVSEGEMRTISAVVVLHEFTALKAAEEMRADFVANVSHELRSPLSSLMGFIETLQGPAADDTPARERFLKIMSSETERMSHLIDDLLSLSRIEAGEHIRPSDAVDIQNLLGQVIDTLSLRAKEKGIEIVVEIAGSLPPVLGEQDQLTEVFENLIDNALKYGGDGSAIYVVAEPVNWMVEIGGPGIEVRVRDEGEGIPPEHIPRLTERFYRVDKSRSRALGSTGLGLAIVKHIVNHHRGRLSIESTPGDGSTFTVALPTVPRGVS